VTPKGQGRDPVIFEAEYLNKRAKWLDSNQTCTRWSQYSPHPGSTQGQGQGKRSRDTGTAVMSGNVCYTVPSDVLSLHALTL